jgi:hypothetical protein
MLSGEMDATVQDYNTTAQAGPEDQATQAADNPSALYLVEIAGRDEDLSILMPRELAFHPQPDHVNELLSAAITEAKKLFIENNEPDFKDALMQEFRKLGIHEAPAPTVRFHPQEKWDYGVFEKKPERPTY